MSSHTCWQAQDHPAWRKGRGWGKGSPQDIAAWTSSSENIPVTPVARELDAWGWEGGVPVSLWVENTVLPSTEICWPDLQTLPIPKAAPGEVSSHLPEDGTGMRGRVGGGGRDLMWRNLTPLPSGIGGVTGVGPLQVPMS